MNRHVGRDFIVSEYPSGLSPAIGARWFAVYGDSTLYRNFVHFCSEGSPQLISIQSGGRGETSCRCASCSEDAVAKGIDI